MGIEIVSARPDHAEFIAWAELVASRSHRETCLWEIFLDRDEETALAFFAALNSTEEPHYGHFSAFFVLEVDGTPAAAMCGYFEEELGVARFVPAIALASQAVGMTPADIAAGASRIEARKYCVTTHAKGAWIVEYVAVRPEFRRRGFVDQLLAHTLDKGRARGATVAEISVFIGNDSAQRAYEKAGFELVEEVRHPEYEAAFRTPGIRLLRREL